MLVHTLSSVVPRVPCANHVQHQGSRGESRRVRARPSRLGASVRDRGAPAVGIWLSAVRRRLGGAHPRHAEPDRRGLVAQRRRGGDRGRPRCCRRTALGGSREPVELDDSNGDAGADVDRVRARRRSPGHECRRDRSGAGRACSRAGRSSASRPTCSSRRSGGSATRGRAGDVSVAGEHLASSAAHRRLGQALEAAGSGYDGAGRVVVGLPPGSRHELGALAFAVAARRAGLPVVYVGADLPIADWIASAEGARAAVIGVVTARDRKAALAVAKGLRDANPGLVVAFGGAAAPADPGILRLPANLAEAVASLEQALDGAARGERVMASLRHERFTTGTGCGLRSAAE